ncbi:hypothetical protein LOTGIDRAFT_159929 [Lottia gigantea]|uniref:Galectin n=1 Tax=Lottia gigantea TaxID=225164 RepID=V3ZYA4_LOTGI|nr:hypothetical protein LOTGIDRAFT_159929 [Lottia gigantea]ESO96513.1 hypothetical protein LOTGIDRAFT_159929 [Lottia gigantea]
MLYSILSLLLITPGVFGVEFKLEAEEFEDNDGSSVKIAGSKHVKIPFCLRRDGIVNLTPISTNGSGILNFQIDGNEIPGANVPCPEKGNTSGGRRTFLTRGRHVLMISAEGGESDLDAVKLDVDDDMLTDAQLHCEVFCQPEIPQHDAHPTEKSPCAKVVQKSKPSKCAEEKNVFMDFYQEKLKKFRITAQHPAYRSLLNARQGDKTNCFKLEENIWEFKYDEIKRLIVQKEDATLEVKERPGRCFLYGVSFHFSHVLHDINVTDISGSLVLEFPDQTLQGDMEVKMSVGDTVIIDNTIRLDSGQTTYEVPYPKNLWHKSNNKVEVKVCGEGSQNIKSIKLTRRKLSKEQGEKIYDDGEFVVEKVKHDMWWLGDPGMKVTINGTNITDTAHYIRVYNRVAWGDYSQNFVIYQDGVIRLLPPTTHGTDWIPFGTFLLSGRFDPDAERVSSRIDQITIEPETSELRVHYSDGNIWRYKLNVGLDKTDVDVEVETANEDLSNLPFLQMRSMYVEDGTSNVDRMSVNGLPEHQIMEDWSALYGSSFFFYRGCISEYHTQSPDTHVQLLD